MFTINQEKKLKPLFSGNLPARRQDLPPVYVINGAIYLAKTTWLQQNKTFIAEETIAFTMPQERSIDIDSEFDLFLLEAYSQFIKMEY